jgi:hypothetical protein
VPSLGLAGTLSKAAAGTSKEHTQDTPTYRKQKKHTHNSFWSFHNPSYHLSRFPASLCMTASRNKTHQNTPGEMLEISAATLEACRWLTFSLVAWCVHADSVKLAKLYPTGADDFLGNADLDAALQPMLLGWRKSAGGGKISAAVRDAVRAAAQIQKVSWAALYLTFTYLYLVLALLCDAFMLSVVPPLQEGSIRNLKENSERQSHGAR